MVLYYSIIFISVCYRGELTSPILIRTLILLLYFYAIYVYDIIEKCLFSYSVSSLLRDTRPNTLLDKFRSGVHTHCCSGKIWSTLRHSFLRNTQTNTLKKKRKSKFLKLFVLWNQHNFGFFISAYFIYSSFFT